MIFLHRILFVCYGNICRSPMAECIFKEMVRRRGVAPQFVIESAATSTEETGSSIFYAAKQKLEDAGIPLCAHRSVQLRRSDYDKFDLIVGMENSNLRSILHIVGSDPEGKVRRLLDFTDTPREIADPWYTRDFDTAYAQITQGCEALLNNLIQ